MVPIVLSKKSWRRTVTQEVVLGMRSCGGMRALSALPIKLNCLSPSGHTTTAKLCMNWTRSAAPTPYFLYFVSNISPLVQTSWRPLFSERVISSALRSRLPSAPPGPVVLDQAAASWNPSRTDAQPKALQVPSCLVNSSTNSTEMEYYTQQMSLAHSELPNLPGWVQVCK